MRKLCYVLGWTALMAVLASCGKQGQTSPPPAQPAEPKAGYLKHALPRLPTVRLWLGSQEVVAEVARRPAEIQTGMMFRTNMAPGEAMLFVFAVPYKTTFYMRNTKVPLSCAYIDPDGAILELHDLKPLDERPVEAASARVQYVLETPQGWFQQHNIGVGAIVRTPHGSLREFDWAALRHARAR
jgi:uncharacterized membrane protein (UPF0127 family)